MKCNCKKELEEKLKEHFSKQAPQATGMQVKLMGYGFGVSDAGMYISQFTEAKATASYPLKSGGTKVKTVKTNMHFGFCPFCGVKAGETA
jgi:hypothetical protein